MVRADEGPRRALLQGGVGGQARGAPSRRSRASLRPSKGMGPPLRGVITSHISPWRLCRDTQDMHPLPTISPGHTMRCCIPAMVRPKGTAMSQNCVRCAAIER